MCVSVSTCAHRLVHLCVQETRCGSLERHHGLPLRWNSLSVSADARREALRGGDWSTAGQPQLDAKTDAQQHECLVTPSCPVFATPWSVAHQAPLSVGSPRQEYWSGLPFPSPDSATWSDPTDKQAGAMGARLSLSPFWGPLCYQARV